MKYSGESRSEKENSIHYLLTNHYKYKVDAVYMVNELVKDNKNFIRNTPAKFRSQVKELKETNDLKEYKNLNKVHFYLTESYEKLERKQLTEIIKNLLNELKKLNKPTESVNLEKMPLKELRAKMIELSNNVDYFKIIKEQEEEKLRRVSPSKMTAIVGKNKKSKKSQKKSARNNKRKPSKKK